jgi:signal transduction histidine kinase
MDQKQFTAVLEASRQFETALAGTGDDLTRRAELITKALHSVCQPPLAACLIKAPAGPVVGIVPNEPWAGQVAKELESWVQANAELPDVALSAATPNPLILTGEPIRFTKTTYGVIALAIEPKERSGARAVLAWAAELLALRFRVEECERHTGEKEPLGRVDLGELTGIVTHQFNNILNDIVLQLAVLERRNLPEEARAEAVAIRQRSQQAAVLVRDLQRYGRSFQASPVALDLNTVVRNAVESLCAAPVKDSGEVQWSLPAGKRLTLRLEQTPGLSPVLGQAPDLSRLLGLLLHSSAATLQGDGGTLQIRTCAGENGPQLIVEDGGAAVTAEMLPRLFEPFTVARKGDDGLGLAVCRGLARRMQANLRGENRPEGGMIFTVNFAQAKSS